MTNNEKHTHDRGDRVAPGSGREGVLPTDLLQDTAQRLALFCAVGAATWATGVVMANVLRPTSVPTPFPWPGNPIGGGMIVLLSVSFLYVRRRPKPLGARTRDLGPGLLVINARLVHGDIKPANVYVCRMGLDYDFVKVLDFGLVKFSARGTRTTLLSVDRVTLGTPAFMAPEVILGEGEVDQRADIYSLGCLAYWMLTGHLVFEAHSPMQMLMAHVEMVPLPPSQRTELPIPGELEQIVLACLEKDPSRRPQNAEVLWQMSLECKGRGTWSRVAARQWWESHLPELTSPDVLATPAARPYRIRSVAVAREAAVVTR